VLLDHGEEVAQQRALIGRQLLGDRIRARRPRAPDGLAHARMSASLVGELSDRALPVAL